MREKNSLGNLIFLFLKQGYLQIHCDFTIISAKFGYGIEEAFVTIGQLCYDEMSQKIEDCCNGGFEITSESQKEMGCWDKLKDSLLHIFNKGK